MYYSRAINVHNSIHTPTTTHWLSPRGVRETKCDPPARTHNLFFFPGVCAHAGSPPKSLWTPPCPCACRRCMSRLILIETCDPCACVQPIELRASVRQCVPCMHTYGRDQGSGLISHTPGLNTLARAGFRVQGSGFRTNQRNAAAAAAALE